VTVCLSNERNAVVTLLKIPFSFSRLAKPSPFPSFLLLPRYYYYCSSVVLAVLLLGCFPNERIASLHALNDCSSSVVQDQDANRSGNTDARNAVERVDVCSEITFVRCPGVRHPHLYPPLMYATFDLLELLAPN